MKKKRFGKKYSLWNRIISIMLLFVTVCSGIMLPERAEAEERKKTITVGYMAFDKFIEKEPDGTMTGMAVDYLNAIGEINGWRYEYVYGNWEELLDGVKNGTIDFLAPAQKTEQREEDYLFSQYSPGVESGILYARIDDERFYYDDFENLDGIRVALMGESYLNEEFEQFAAEKGFSYVPVYYEDVRNCFEALDAKETDAVVIGNLAGKEGYKVLSRVGSISWYFISGKENTGLMAEFNQAQGKLLAEDPSLAGELYEKYYGNTAAENDLLFTREEMEYIRTAGTIRVGQLIGRYPLSSMGDGTLSGINEDILKEISEMSGLDLKSVPLEQGVSTLSAVKTGKYDLVMGTVDNSRWRNDEAVTLSKDYMEGAMAMVTRPGEIFGPEDKAVVGIKRSFQVMQEYVEKNYPEYTIKYYDDYESILDEMLKGNVDIMIESIYVIDYLLQKPKYEKLEIVSSGYMEEKNCFIALSGENDMLISILNRCISHLSEENLNKIILQNTSAKPYKLTIYDMVYKYRIELAIIVFLLAICFALFGFTTIFRQRHAKMMKAKNEQLAVAVTVAENANQAKSRFLSQMSHEIRTPMNAIVGITNIAKNHLSEPEKMEHYLEKIGSSSQLLLHIINDVLDMSAIESGKLKIDKSAFDLEQCMQEIYEIYEPQCRNKGIKLSLYVNIDHPVVNGDSLRVNQIMLNLISNAVKFTKKGGRIAIKVIEKQVNENIVFMEFSIEDTGCGMNKEMLERLYQPFEQESTATARKYGGSGLGTAIAKALTELMEGAIQVESEPGEGTIFYVDIPFEIDTELEEVQEEFGKETEFYDFSGSRVLLVEDNELNAEIAKELLEQVKLTVDYAENGAEGLRQLEESEPGTYDLILMDVQMPVMDGWEATKAIRKSTHPDGATIPIYAMTANAFREDVAVSLSSGMNGHIAKPIDTRLLYQVLEKVLKKDE